MDLLAETAEAIAACSMVGFCPRGGGTTSSLPLVAVLTEVAVSINVAKIRVYSLFKEVWGRSDRRQVKG